MLHTKPHNRKWSFREFVYTNGSQIKDNLIFGAGVVNPRANTITHIEIESQAKRHTINRAELAAITVALRIENTADHLSILTNNSFCINTIRNYIIYPVSYTTTYTKIFYT